MKYFVFYRFKNDGAFYSSDSLMKEFEYESAAREFLADKNIMLVRVVRGEDLPIKSMNFSYTTTVREVITVWE